MDDDNTHYISRQEYVRAQMQAMKARDWQQTLDDARRAEAHEISVRSYHENKARAEEGMRISREHLDMARHSHNLQMKRHEEELRAARQGRQLQAAFIRDTQPSGQLGNAGYATEHNSKRLDMRRPNGLYLCMFNGEPLYFNGEGHGLTYGPIRSGKGVSLLYPNLAHLKHQSVVVIDTKSGETMMGTARHRFHNLGHEVVCINPHGIADAPHTVIDPCDHVRHAPRSEVIEKSIDLCSILIPSNRTDGENAWVAEDCGSFSAHRLAFLAQVDPERCTIEELYRFWHQSDAGMRADFEAMSKSEMAEIAGVGESCAAILSSRNQFNAYRAKAHKELEAFGPSTLIAAALRGKSKDIRDARHTPHTIYFVSKGVRPSIAKYLTLVLTHTMESLAYSPGPVKTVFLLDEFADLPPIPHLASKLATYAGIGAGMQFWFLTQSPKLIDRVYGRDLRDVLEQQAGFVMAWGVTDPELMKWMEINGGIATVKTLSANVTGNAVESGGLSVGEHPRPLLQPEDIRNMRPDEVLIFLQYGPVFRGVRVPYWKVSPWKHVLDDGRTVMQGAKLGPLVREQSDRGAS